ncbi:MAG TPA: YhcH/YjgK/YiaL family protein [Prolixibacteraceae bacterium]|nr:YhcH/YjgK/YiaL family protein [Prolixibacteraceae bacterium]HPS12945.1 YhcH/YjgK/YiaL family protein [Prolixibacteraceae bacterium]
MILDAIENADLYKSISPLLAEGMKFLSENNFETIEPGKFYLKDQLLYAMVNEYETKPMEQCKLEAHRQYIDIQFMVSGEERVGYVAFEGQTPSEAYNPEKDVVFFQENVSLFTLKKGSFAVFFPNDLHQPCILSGEAARVRKVVVKVAV